MFKAGIVKQRKLEPIFDSWTERRGVKFIKLQSYDAWEISKDFFEELREKHKTKLTEIISAPANAFLKKTQRK